jgi:hypothetical protein
MCFWRVLSSGIYRHVVCWKSTAVSEEHTCSAYFSNLKMEAICSSEASLTFNGLCGVISQKIVLFITTAVRTSNITKLALSVPLSHTHTHTLSLSHTHTHTKHHADFLRQFFFPYGKICSLSKNSLMLDICSTVRTCVNDNIALQWRCLLFIT